MFCLEQIEAVESGGGYRCQCICGNEEIAFRMEQEFFKPVRMQYYFAELYHQGNVLILETPDRKKTEDLAALLNTSLENLL